MPDLTDLSLAILPLGLALYPPGAHFGPRVMRDYEFVWIIDGETVWICDGKEYPAPPGTLILARPGMEDAFRWDPLNTTRHAYYHFRIRRRPEDFPPEPDWPRLLLLPRGDILRPLWRHMAALQEANRPGLQGLFENAARQMLAAFVSGMVHSLGEGRVALPEPIEAVLRHLQQSWQGGRLEPPTLERLAQVAAVSPGHLCRLFKQAYGRGPMEVLRKVRLDRAATMLSHTNLQIQEIARLTGFENAFHFSRCFRTEFGASPRSFRIKMAEGKFTPGSRFHQRHQMTSRLWGEL